MDALDEMAGRAAEMDRPVHFTTGFAEGGLFSKRSAEILAGYSVLTKLAEACARYKVPIYLTSTMQESIPLMTEVIENEYKAAGCPELFDPHEHIVVPSPNQYAYLATQLDLWDRKKFAANILAGAGASSTYTNLYVASKYGAISLTSTSNISGGTGHLAAVADHLLIGTELCGAGAVASNDPAQLGSLMGESIMEGFTIALIVLGWLAIQVGSTAIKDFIKL
jgi:hypothetical protein